jgi:hypothetical protein
MGLTWFKHQQLGISWEFHGKFMGISREFHGKYCGLTINNWRFEWEFTLR